MENESLNEKTMDDVHTKQIDLVNRDPKRINDDVVKVSRTCPYCMFLRADLEGNVSLSY